MGVNFVAEWHISSHFLVAQVVLCGHKETRHLESRIHQGIRTQRTILQGSGQDVRTRGFSDGSAAG